MENTTENRKADDGKKMGSSILHTRDAADGDAGEEIRDMLEHLLCGILSETAGLLQHIGHADTFPVSGTLRVGHENMDNGPVVGVRYRFFAVGADPYEDCRTCEDRDECLAGPPVRVPVGNIPYPDMTIRKGQHADKAGSARTKEASSERADLPGGRLHGDGPEMYRDMQVIRSLLFSACSLVERIEGRPEDSRVIGRVMAHYLNLADAAMEKWKKYSMAGN